MVLLHPIARLFGLVYLCVASVRCAAFSASSDDSQRNSQHPLLIRAPPRNQAPNRNDSVSLNLIDLLSESRDHTILVRLLQRTRLIPTLNRLQEFDDGSGVTILAPTNDAFLRKRDEHASLRPNALDGVGGSPTLWEYVLDEQVLEDGVECVWSRGVCMEVGNVNAVVRQYLLYHVLNYTLPFSLTNQTGVHSPRGMLPEVGRPQMHTTLHFPSHRMLTEPTHPGRVPLPHQEDHGGLLGHHGQRLRVALLDDTGTTKFHLPGSIRPLETKRPVLYFGTDETGRGGARSINEDWRSKNGVIHYIDSVLDLPPSLDQVILTHPRLNSIRHLISNDTLQTLSTVPHLTLFLPTSEAFDHLSALESTYLFGDFAQSALDRLKLVGWHISASGLGDNSPVYSSSFRALGHTSLTTALGGTILVETDPKSNTIRVMGANMLQEDVLIENGVVHIIDELILPFGDLDMSIEAMLMVLNATRFVRLVYEVGMEAYISRPAHVQRRVGERFTFLVPRDDVMDVWLSQSSSLGWHSADRTRVGLDDVVRYHILRGQIRPDDLASGMLLDTELHDSRLREARQKMPVQVDDDTQSGSKPNADVAFGDANVLRSPVEVRDSAMVYVVSQLLQPPSDPLHTAVSYLSLSTFVATVFSADLNKAVECAPGVSYLVPTNDAFARLGLAMSFLLLPESQHLLQSLVEYHAIDKIVYKSEVSEQTTEFATLLPNEAAKLAMRKQKNGQILVHKAGYPNGTKSVIVKADMLTNTGVIHQVDKVQIPFDLTIRDLLRGAKANTMEDLMIQAGYQHILNSTIASNRTNPNPGAFLVLVPTDTAFTKVNLSAILDDRDLLVRLVQQHLIPLDHKHTIQQFLPDSNADAVGLQDQTVLATLLDRSQGGTSSYGRVSFRKVAEPRMRRSAYDAVLEHADSVGLGWIVGIKDTRGSSASRHFASVMAFGQEARGIIHNGIAEERPPMGGVFQIDTVLTPYTPNWFYSWGWIVLTLTLVTTTLCTTVVFAVRWWNGNKRIHLTEALEGEEE